MKNKGLFLCFFMLLLMVLNLSGVAHSFSFGDRVKVLWRGQWHICTIKGGEPGKVKIHFEDDEKLFDRWISINKVKNYTYKIGEIVLSRKEDRWLTAKVLAAGTLKYKVHFIGFENQYDKWVGPSEIKDIFFKVGKMVLVYWNDDWFQAKILRYENGKYKVHYKNFPDSYDEWVTVDKIKLK